MSDGYLIAANSIPVVDQQSFDVDTGDYTTVWVNAYYTLTGGATPTGLLSARRIDFLLPGVNGGSFSLTASTATASGTGIVLDIGPGTVVARNPGSGLRLVSTIAGGPTTAQLSYAIWGAR